MATFLRLGRRAVVQASSSVIKQSASEGSAAKAVSQQFSLQTRGFASGGHRGEGVTHAGLTLHKPAGWHVAVGKGMAGLMWFWIFYRFYHDYDTFLFGHAQHHEHTLHAKEHEKKEH